MKDLEPHVVDFGAAIGEYAEHFYKNGLPVQMIVFADPRNVEKYLLHFDQTKAHSDFSGPVTVTAETLCSGTRSVG